MYTDNDAMEKLLGVYRHDFLNVLQVVGGLAQLHKTDRLLAYIRKASEEVQQFGRLIACGDSRLALVIYERLLQYLPGGYLLHVSGIVPPQPVHYLQRVEKTLQALQEQVKVLGEGMVAVAIKGTGSPEITVGLLFESVPHDFWSPVLTVARESGLHTEINKERE